MLRFKITLREGQLVLSSLEHHVPATDVVVHSLTAVTGGHAGLCFRDFKAGWEARDRLLTDAHRDPLAFEPTHRIIRPPPGREATEVCLPDADGPAYTRDEWMRNHDAAWSFEGGEWCFNGEPQYVHVEALQR